MKHSNTNSKTKDYTEAFDIFCEAFALELNLKADASLAPHVTKREVKAMPEAVDAFIATLELINVLEVLE